MVARLLLLLSLVLFAPAIFPASITETEYDRVEDRFAPSATLAAVDTQSSEESLLLDANSLDPIATINADSEQSLGFAVTLSPDGPSIFGPDDPVVIIPEPGTMGLIGLTFVVGLLARLAPWIKLIAQISFRRLSSS